ncbi:hypothetical protein AcW2_001402 [Taiwanofungus camphoratus]|nr:hypothetical protein AcW2_001402 [Antrodia cinnamomea]
MLNKDTLAYNLGRTPQQYKGPCHQFNHVNTVLNKDFPSYLVNAKSPFPAMMRSYHAANLRAAADYRRWREGAVTNDAGTSSLSEWETSSDESVEESEGSEYEDSGCEYSGSECSESESGSDESREIGSEPETIDEPWRYTFQPGDCVWVKAGSRWYSGKVRKAVGSSKRPQVTLYVVIFRGNLKGPFVPEDGVIKPDTPHIRELLRADGWL